MHIPAIWLFYDVAWLIILVGAVLAIIFCNTAIDLFWKIKGTVRKMRR